MSDNYDFNKSKLDNNLKKEEKKNIHEGHRKRLRKLFSSVDPLTMPEHQILELMLSYVQPQKDVNPLAHKLLDEFGSLSEVLDASEDNLKRIKGVGETLASYLHFCSKLPAIYNVSKTNIKQKLTTPLDMTNFFKSQATFGTTEIFYYLCLNSRGNVLRFKTFGLGSVSRVFLSHRDLVHDILRYPTDTVVICHTHPNGTPYPSEDDKTFTKKLYDILEKLSIKLCDHIILSPVGCYSFYENPETWSFVGRKILEDNSSYPFDKDK